MMGTGRNEEWYERKYQEYIRREQQMTKEEIKKRIEIFKEIGSTDKFICHNCGKITNIMDAHSRFLCSKCVDIEFYEKDIKEQIKYLYEMVKILRDREI